MILKIGNGDKFLLVVMEGFLGTRFLLVKKGLIEYITKEELDFVVTSLAILEGASNALLAGGVFNIPINIPGFINLPMYARQIAPYSY